MASAAESVSNTNMEALREETSKLTKGIESGVGNLQDKIKDMGTGLMSKITNNTIFKNHKQTLLYVGLALILLIISSIFFYKRYLLKILKPNYVSNNEYITGDSDENIINNVKIILYYANWCSHSMDVYNNVWKQLQSSLKDSLVNGTKIEFIEKDCSDDSNEKLQEEIKNIDGYPTIVMDVDGKKIIYENDISSDNTNAEKEIKEFIKNNI